MEGTRGKLLWFGLGFVICLALAAGALAGPLRGVWRTATPTPAASPTETWSPTPVETAVPAGGLTWTREGGLAGFCDRLSIDGAGAVTYGRCAETPEAGTLTDAEWATLADALARYVSFDYVAEDNPGGADNLRITLHLSGRGTQVADGAEQARLAGWAQTLYARLQESGVEGTVVAEARTQLATRLDLVPDTIRVVSAEKTTWPNACLGIQVAGVDCAAVPTEGYRIVLEAGGQQYEYRSDLFGLVRAASETPLPSETPAATATPVPTSTPVATATSQPSPTPYPTWTPYPTPAPTRAPIPSDAWRGEYYDNADLSGYPVVVRNDANLSFDWGYTAPDSRLPDDYFSVRWTRLVYFSEGDYHFQVRADDGVRLRLDGSLVIDRWYGGTNQETVTRHVSAGVHEVVVEYFEWQGVANVRVAWQKLTTPTRVPTATPTLEPWITDWRGAYYGNTQLAGTPLLVRNDTAIDFDWQLGSPAAGIPADRWSARWTRRVNVAGGAYHFTARADDGVRVWVDGQLLIDAWPANPLAGYSGDIWLAAGYHDLRVEYYEDGGYARVKVDWAPLTQFSGWQGVYYGNRDLSGNPVMVRDDAQIAFDWGEGRPSLLMPADDFSVRWTRTMTLAGGLYRLWARVDDGVRVYVDGQRQINEWHDAGNGYYQRDLHLATGNHAVVVEYYEHNGSARVGVGLDALVLDTPTATATTTRTPTPTQTATLTQTPTATQTATTTSTASPVATATSTATATATDTPMATATPTGTPVATATATTTSTPTPTGTPLGGAPTMTAAPTSTPSGTPVATATSTPAATATPTATATSTDTPIATPTATPVATATPTDTLAPTATSTATPVASATPTATSIGTATPTPTGTIVALPWSQALYANATLTEPAQSVGAVAAVSFDWGLAAPAPGLPVDGFSARWSYSDTLAGGAYVFHLQASGGARVWLNGVLLVDEWESTAVNVNVQRELTAGVQQIVVEYVNRQGEASVAFSWTAPGGELQGAPLPGTGLPGSTPTLTPWQRRVPQFGRFMLP